MVLEVVVATMMMMMMMMMGTTTFDCSDEATQSCCDVCREKEASST